MWIKYQQLATSVAKSLKPIYLLSGDEPLQLGEAADLIRKTAKQQGYDSREVLTVEGRFSWHDFAQCADSYSIFSEKKLIDLRIPTAKVGAEGSKALIHYCKRLPEDTLLLISAGKLDKSAKKSKWVTMLEQYGIALQVWPLEGQALLNWLQQRLIKRGLTVDESGIKLIATQVEGNLLAAAQEIEKLYVLYGQAKLTVTDIEQVLTDVSRYDVFNLVDAALSGRVARVTKILAALKAEGIAPSIILWALAREARHLIHIQLALSKGEASHAVFMRYQIWDKRQKLVQHVLTKLDQHTLMAILLMAAKVDRQIKGVETEGDYWQGLLVIALSLAGHHL